jgi:hypothetical protein
MNTTVKNDWMNDYLSDNGYYVSDHGSYRNSLGLPIQSKVSLRFFGNVRIGYYYAIVINCEEPYWSKCITNSLLEHTKKLSLILDKKVSILIFDDHQDIFCIYTNEIQKFSSQELIKYFSNINSNLTTDSGTFKGINKTTNDAFQDWTRKNLSKYVACNDIDAFKINGDTIELIELKRPVQECYKWSPYLNDYGNYKALQVMGSNNFGIQPIFTLAYNANNNEHFVVFKLIKIEKDIIEGLLSKTKASEINFLKGFSSLTFQPFISQNKI